MGPDTRELDYLFSNYKCLLQGPSAVSFLQPVLPPRPEQGLGKALGFAGANQLSDLDENLDSEQLRFPCP